MHVAGLNLPYQLVLHRVAPTASHYLPVQTFLCQNHIPVPWQVCLLYTRSHLHPLIASLFLKDVLLWKARNTERQTNFPSYTAAQTFWNGLWNQWHRKEITKLWCSRYPAVLGTQMIRFWYAPKLHTSQGSQCEYVLIMKPLSAYNQQCWPKSSWQLQMYSFFDILIGRATTDIWESQSRLTSHLTHCYLGRSKPWFTLSFKW